MNRRCSAGTNAAVVRSWIEDAAVQPASTEGLRVPGCHESPGELGDPRYAARVAALFRDPDTEVRYRAAAALAI